MVEREISQAGNEAEFTPGEMEYFVRKQLELWNALDRAGMTAMYRQHAPNGLIIEYVGHPIGDGWDTFNHMWDNYGTGEIRTEIKEIIANGNEVACYFHNVRIASGKYNPSIEIYKMQKGVLHIRYFHNEFS